MGCPIYGGDNRPDYDADGVACVVKWMQEAQDYLARGGKPTKYTDQRNFENYRRLARERMAHLSTWLDRAAWEPKRLPPKAAAVVPAPVPAGVSSQEHYLTGIIFYQKGDYAKAHQEWLLSKQLDPSNGDAQAALERVKKYLTADAVTPAR